MKNRLMNRVVNKYILHNRSIFFENDDEVEQFLEKVVFPHVVDENYTANRDYKTELQEYMHRHNKGNITYHLLDESGPAHHKMFTSEVLLNGKPLETGKGRTKKESEQNAAKKALNNGQ